MPFETTLPSYVNNNTCFNSPLVAKEYNGGGTTVDIGHPRNPEDGGEDSPSADVDDSSNNEEDTKILDDEQQKFLVLSRNFYPEENVPSSVPASVPYSTFHPGKLFYPYQGRLQNLPMSPFSSHFEEESPRSVKSPFESSNFVVDYKEDKIKNAVSYEEQDQKLFIAGDDSSDVFVQKPIFPWMVDSRHNTKNRQQQVYDGDKEQFNNFLGIQNEDI